MPVPDLESLAIFPAILQRVVDATPESLWGDRSNEGIFSLLEQAWHLADLEEEAYAVRIARLLTEESPSFEDFAGGVTAIERRYFEQELPPALNRYRSTREANRSRLAAVQPGDWSRHGTMEWTGRITLADVAGSMLQHDVAHANEVATVLSDLGLPVPEELTSFAARKL